MTEKDEIPDVKTGILIKTTLVDFPGIVASAFFMKGCNLRCPYCYNTGLVLPENDFSEERNAVSIKELFSHLEKRRGVIKGFVLSGGEPLLSPLSEKILKTAKFLGYKVKLDTNGTLTEKLSSVISNPETKPDFISMDLKTSLSRYSEMNPVRNLKLKEKILSSISVLKSLPETSYEFRTVLVPGLVNSKEIKEISEIIPENASWKFSIFQNGQTLNPAFQEIIPQSDSEIKRLMEVAQNLRKNASLR